METIDMFRLTTRVAGRFSYFAALILGSVLVANGTGEAVSVDSSAMKIRQVLDFQVAAWNKGDLKGFMAGYWKSEKLTFFSGDKIEHGWQATYERYQKRYQAEGREMGTLTFSEIGRASCRERV